MTGAIRLNHLTKEILISKSFAKTAMNPNSTEYKDLAEVMMTHPDYTVIRRTIKKNSRKKTYLGLTYDYMRDYIITHSPADDTSELDEFDELILISRCQQKGKRYPAIKNWFLEKHPEIKEFGMPPKEEETEEDTEQEDELPEEKTS